MKSGIEDVGKKSQRGSSTIEAALIMPLLMGVVIMVIYLSVYLYNRAAATSLAARTAVLSGQMEHEGSNVIEAKADKALREGINALPMTADREAVADAGLLSVNISVSFDQGRGVFLIPAERSSYHFEKNFKVVRLDPAKFIWSVKIVENKKGNGHGSSTENEYRDAVYEGRR